MIRPLISLLLLAPLAAQANPTGPMVVPGAATFGPQVIVPSATPAIIQWQNFSIQGNEAGRFIQQNSSSAVLNRVQQGTTQMIQGGLQPAAPQRIGVQLLAPNVYVAPAPGASSAVDMQIPLIRPASAGEAVRLPDGRIVFRTTQQ